MNTVLKTILTNNNKPFTEEDGWVKTIIADMPVEIQYVDTTKNASFASRYSSYKILLREHGKVYDANLIDGIFYGKDVLMIRDLCDHQ